MNASKSRLVRLNTACWLAAMVLPSALDLALAGTRFPWAIVLPLLLIGPMLASNGFVARGGTSEVAPGG